MTSPLSAEGVNVLASIVIRPPRAAYHRRDLGHRRFRTRGARDVGVTRTDVQLVNARGQTLQCSHYVPDSPDGAPLPVVVYLHGNGSCRVEAEILFDQTLPYGMSVFAFDFSGSGKSDGEYISLGVFEKFDVETVVAYLASCQHVSAIALWGHSMGAATAVMYAGMVDPIRRGSSSDEKVRPGKLPFLPKGNLGGLARGGSFIRRHSASRHNSVGVVGTAMENSPPTGSAPPAPSGNGNGPAASPTFAGVSSTWASANTAAGVQAGGSADGSSGEPGSKSTVDSTYEPARVKALVLDSAFASFDKLASAMVETMPLPPAVPRRLILSVGVRAVRKAVRDQAGFDINDIDPLSACKNINPTMPAIFLQGTHDEIVHLPHADMLVDAYPGRDKELLIMQDIDHDAPRPGYAIEKAFVLLQRTLFDDHGTRSVRFATALKLRGNDVMVEGRYGDASYLYTTAIEAISRLEWSQRHPDGSPIGRVGGMPTGANLSPFQTPTPVVSESKPILENIWPDSEDDELLAAAVPVGTGGDSLPRPASAANRISSRFSSSVRKISRAGSARRRPPDEDDEHTSPVRRRRGGPFGHVRTQNGEGAGKVGSGEAAAPSRTEGANESSDRVGSVDGNSYGQGEQGRLRFPRIPMKRGSFRQSKNSTREPEMKTPRNERNEQSHGTPHEERLNNISSNEEYVDVRRCVRSGFIDCERKTAVLALLGNRSLARTKNKAYEEALHDAELAIELDSKWVRGYQRKATALKCLGRIDDARLTVMEGLRVAPECSPLLAMECELEEEALAAAMAASMRDQPPGVRGGQRYDAAVGGQNVSLEGVDADGFMRDNFDRSDQQGARVESETVGPSSMENEALA